MVQYHALFIDPLRTTNGSTTTPRLAKTGGTAGQTEQNQEAAAQPGNHHPRSPALHRRLDRADIVQGWSGSSSGRRKSGNSRAESLTSRTITLTHRPTGISVPVHIREGNYSKKDMRKASKEAVERHMPILDAWVRRYLKTLVARQFGPPEVYEPKKEPTKEEKLLEEIFGKKKRGRS